MALRIKSPCVLIILSPIFASLLTSCGGTVESKTPTETVSQPLPEVKAALENQPQSPPFKAVVLIDKSLSVEGARIKQAKVGDFQVLLDVLQRHGGELAVGTFCSDSNYPLIRIRVEPKPELVNEGFNHPVPPIIPVNEGNALIYRKKNKEYKEKLAEYENLRQQDLQRLASYQNSVQQWQSESKVKIKEFMTTQVKSTLEEPVNCGSSDIQGGINRANLFLTESDATWIQQPRKFAAFITDGLDNVGVGIQGAEFDLETEVLLVNGAGSKGIFNNIEHKAFESVAASFQYLVTQVNKGEK